MSTQWIPNYIKRNINYKPKDILTAQEYNAILNLLITQGDYNASWLEYLTEEGIPDAIKDIAEEEIEAAISTAVREEISALAASVVNKTALYLNAPAVTIMDISMDSESVYTLLKPLLESKNLYATYAVAVNLVGYGLSYLTLAQLNTLKSLGNDIVARGTDGTALTAINANTVASASHTFMDTNNFNKDVFIYPQGNSISDVTAAVHNYFGYAANELNANLFNTADYPFTASAAILGNLPIIRWDNTVDVDTIKEYIDTIVEHNQYMILQIDCSASTFDIDLFEEIIDYMLTKSSLEFPTSITAQMQLMHSTIGNKLAVLDGMYITENNGEKYLNW